MHTVMYSLGTQNEELINRFLFVSTRGACSGGIRARAAAEERHVGSLSFSTFFLYFRTLLWVSAQELR